MSAFKDVGLVAFVQHGGTMNEHCTGTILPGLTHVAEKKSSVSSGNFYGPLFSQVAQVVAQSSLYFTNHVRILTSLNIICSGSTFFFCVVFASMLIGCPADIIWRERADEELCIARKNKG